ncbi:MAG: hypothetical protein Fur0046_30280 [Cyanobacteria bacterium J069]|nr:MAG: hybrid sensor histidine kinase/response regulator [Cyanobacteria bacterium J069]
MKTLYRRYPQLLSLKARLVLLVLLAVVPALGMVLHTASIQRRHAEQQVQENLLRFTKFSAANQKQATEATRQLLATLAELPEIRSDDGDSCDRLLNQLLDNYTAYAALGVADANGNVRCSAPIARQRMAVSDRSYFRLARSTRSFAVGDYQIGRVTGRPTLNFSYPVLTETGQVQAVVFAALALDQLKALAAEVQLPPGSVVTVVDRNGTILVRYPDSRNWIGVSARQTDVTQRALSRPEGTIEAVGVDGMKRLYAFTSLGTDNVNKNIHVIIGIPRAIAFADANRLLLQNLISLAAVATLAIAAAWVGGDLFLIRRVKSLVSTTQQIRSGNLSARTEFVDEPGELGQLASAFDEMAETLEMREIERQRDEYELKQAAAALRHSEERYRYLAETIPQLVWAANAEGQLTDINQRWSDFTGLTLEDVKTEGWEAVVHPDDIPTLNQQWVAAQQTGRPYRAEGRMRRTDGAYRWHLHEAIPLKNEQGEVIKWFGTATDIEVQKQVEHQRQHLLEQEQAAREQAETANRIKDEFLAVLSHELRSPLNPILGWSKLLRDGNLDAARTRYAIETIERNAKLQVQLIDDLLDISRILRGKLSLTIQPVDLIGVISASLETVRLAAEAKSLDLQFIMLDSGLDADRNADLAGELRDAELHHAKETSAPQASQNAPQMPKSQILNPKFQVLGDAGRLQQVVWNLVCNAVKFTPSGGQILVELSADEAQAQIQVKDTGKGINRDFLPFVFEHFRQEDSATTRKFGGLGLGLAIVRQIVEMHGGVVSVDSAGEGQGATFTVQIPLAPFLLEPPAVYSSAEAIPNLSNQHILIVDDDADSRGFTTFVLEQTHATITSVASGQEALRRIAESPPDLLISDIGMPHMDGYMLIQQIRALPSEQGGTIPAIALTAYAGEMDQQQAIAAGFQQHLAKPIEAEALMNTVAKLIAPNDSDPRNE